MKKQNLFKDSSHMSEGKTNNINYLEKAFQSLTKGNFIK